MPPECTESGCGEAGRWMVGERSYCASHGIQASTRGSVAMRLVCPIVEEIVVDDSDVVGMAPATISDDAASLASVSVWDRLEAELAVIGFGSPDARGRLWHVAKAAIKAGREGSR